MRSAVNLTRWMPALRCQTPGKFPNNFQSQYRDIQGPTLEGKLAHIMQGIKSDLQALDRT